ncbi:hypothetical protein SAMN02745126_05057 [Enhydrobacter aerosaccus]|uniref:Uncharacterized protein n=1 Tax=Enhydrobacter aerosaccus TaxID=225324 RepID=A0A1T4SRN2_9HYPH|nr:hypothetical protein [Enhydrobacter aerosaccus]SKA30950.1 hypothetical protein SAMN02745126_05057 [Enhydrobacter aerosaccus]
MTAAFLDVRLADARQAATAKALQHGVRPHAGHQQDVRRQQDARRDVARLLGLDRLPAEGPRLACGWQREADGRLVCRWEPDPAVSVVPTDGRF